MADNYDLQDNTGSGVKAVTDEITSPYTGGSAHAQGVKLLDGTVDGATVAKVGSHGLEVDPRPESVAQAQNSAGLTTASTAYSAGDVLGSGWTFTGMARASGGRGRITGVTVIDKADVVSVVDFYLASAAITFGTDNAAPSVSDTDAEKLLHVISVPLLDLGGVRFGSAASIAVPYSCDATSLFVYAVTGTAHSFFGAVSDVRVRLTADLD